MLWTISMGADVGILGGSAPPRAQNLSYPQIVRSVKNLTILSWDILILTKKQMNLRTYSQNGLDIVKHTTRPWELWALPLGLSKWFQKLVPVAIGVGNGLSGLYLCP